MTRYNVLKFMQRFFFTILKIVLALKNLADYNKLCIESLFLILKGELDEIVAELEESRRKLVSLKMQKDAATGMNSSSADAVNGNVSPEKPADRALGLPELKNLIEEAKVFVE